MLVCYCYPLKGVAMKIEKVDEKKKVVYFSGTVTADNSAVLGLYIDRGYIVEEVEPKAKKKTASKKQWEKSITDDKDKMEFEKLCKTKGVGFFGAVSWAKEKGYSAK